MDLGTAIGIAGGFIQVIFDKYLTHVLEKWASDMGLNEEYKLLEDNLEFIKIGLGFGQVKKGIQNYDLVKYIQCVQYLVYQADDLLDEMDYYRIEREIENDSSGSSSSSTQDSVSKFSILKTYIPIYRNEDAQTQDSKRKIDGDQSLIRNKRTKFQKDDLSRRIHIVVENLKEVGKKLYKLLNVEKLDQIVRANVDTSTLSPLKSSHLMESRVFGRDEEKEFIIGQLVGVNFANTNLSVLPIVGNGGVGKTTLARLVFNDSKIIEYFELTMWIHVSADYDESRLIRELLEFIPGEECKQGRNLNRQLEILKKFLSSKKFLLVLDDVWEDNDKSKWERLLSLLQPEEKNGNVILLTTRKLSVAKIINEKHMIKLDGLKENDFWKLFKLHAFSDEKYEKHDILERIGEQICKKLSNYPLAAKTVGAMLKINPNIIYWRNVRDNEEWKSQTGPDDIMPALRLSYEYLPFHLQRCFSFCSLFHKGFKYYKEELVNMWIAQGFVFLNNSTIPVKDIGNIHFDRLVNSGFLEEVKGPFSQSRYVIHDLMHDLAQIVSQHDCFAIVNSNNLNTGIPNTIRHLSIITETYPSSVLHNQTIPSGNFEKYIVHIKKHLQVENLSTLIIIGRYNSNSAVVLKDFLERLKGLRVLVIYTMSGDVDSLTCNFSEFIHLRYLQLHCCPWQLNDIQRDVLNNLNKLYHLEIISIDKYNIRGMFKEDNYLWPWESRDPMFDSKIPWVGKLTALHELREFRVRKESGFEIAQLGLLMKLRNSLQIFNLENVASKEQAVRARLEEKSFLNSLYLCWNREPGEYEPAMDADVLEKLRPNYNLERLLIGGYGGVTSPTWLVNENTLDYLVLLYLHDCKAWEILPPLGHLLSLKKLQLRNMFAFKEIDVPFYGIGANMGFRALEEMEIHDMPKLEKWRGSNQWQAFHCLKKLTINNCPELTEFLNFEFAFSGDTSKNWFPHLHDLTIRKCEKLRYLSWESLCGLVNLKRLTIITCPKLFLSFEPNEQSVENSFLPLSLEYLDIYLSDITGKQLSILLLNLTNLNELKIVTCRQITALKVASITTSCFTNSADPINNQGLLQIPYFLKSTLKTLQIYGCSDLIFASKEGIGALTSIEVLGLTLGGSNLLSSITNLGEHVNECCFLPPGVSTLQLYNVPDNIISSLLTPLTSLLYIDITDSPSLTTLKLPPCSTLKSLVIYNCENLVSLEGLLFPTQLKCLCTTKCPNFVALNSVTRLENPNTDESGVLIENLTLSNTNFLSDPVCKQLSTLKSLSLRGDEIVDLTEEQEKALRLLTSLEKLQFLNCNNLNSLPNQLCNLSSLKALEIVNCRSIQSLPENGLPPSLESLYIISCSDELKRQCSNITSIKRVSVH